MDEIKQAKSSHLYAIIALLIVALISFVWVIQKPLENIREELLFWAGYRVLNFIWLSYLFYFLVKLKEQKINMIIILLTLGFCVYSFLVYIGSIFLFVSNNQFNIGDLDDLLFKLPRLGNAIVIILFSINLLKNTLELKLQRTVRYIGILYIAVAVASIIYYTPLRYFPLHYDWLYNLIDYTQPALIVSMIILYIQELQTVSYLGHGHRS